MASGDILRIGGGTDFSKYVTHGTYTSVHQSQTLLDIEGSGFLTSLTNSTTTTTLYTVEADSNGIILQFTLTNTSFPILINFNNNLIVRSNQHVNSSRTATYLLD